MNPRRLLLPTTAILLLAITSCRHRDPYADYGNDGGAATGDPDRDRELYERGYRDGAEASGETAEEPYAELPQRRQSTSSVNVGVGYGGGGRHGGSGWGGGINIGNIFGGR